MLPSLVGLRGLEWGVRGDSEDHEGSGATLSLGNAVSTGLIITLYHSQALAIVPLGLSPFHFVSYLLYQNVS